MIAMVVDRFQRDGQAQMSVNVAHGCGLLTAANDEDLILVLCSRRRRCAGKPARKSDVSHVHQRSSSTNFMMRREESKGLTSKTVEEKVPQGLRDPEIAAWLTGPDVAEAGLIDVERHTYRSSLPLHANISLLLFRYPGQAPRGPHCCHTRPRQHLSYQQQPPILCPPFPLSFSSRDLASWSGRPWLLFQPFLLAHFTSWLLEKGCCCTHSLLTLAHAPHFVLLELPTGPNINRQSYYIHVTRQSTRRA